MGIIQEGQKEIWFQFGPEGTTLRMTPESFNAHQKAQVGPPNQPHVIVSLGSREGTQLRVLPENLQGVLENLQRRG